MRKPIPRRVSDESRQIDHSHRPENMKSANILLAILWFFDSSV